MGASRPPEEEEVLIMWPNKPDPVNPANASRFAVVHHWRGVSDPERYASA